MKSLTGRFSERVKLTLVYKKKYKEDSCRLCLMKASWKFVVAVLLSVVLAFICFIIVDRESFFNPCWYIKILAECFLLPLQSLSL